MLHGYNKKETTSLEYLKKKSKFHMRNEQMQHYILLSSTISAYIINCYSKAFILQLISNLDFNLKDPYLICRMLYKGTHHLGPNLSIDKRTV